MAKSNEKFNKIEKEKIKLKKKKDKEKKKEERKANSGSGGMESMIAYVDENGNLTSTPPDPKNKIQINAEDIEISITKNRHSDVVDAPRKGTVTYFNTSKGYGFIKEDDTNESIFTHINGHVGSIKENDRVTYDVERGQKGLNAINVQLLVKTTP